MQISDLAIQNIKGNNKAMAGLAYAFEKHFKTIENWLANKDIRLTTPTAVDVIKAETGLSEDEILVKESSKA